MSKLDWTRASQINSDPARCDSGNKEFQTFSPTEAVKKEFAAKKKVRSDAARQAAKTRKLNREIALERALQAEADASAARKREAEFFAKTQANFTKRNEARRMRRSKDAESLLTPFGKLLGEAFKR
jgi:hypothetical protein